MEHKAAIRRRLLAKRRELGRTERKALEAGLWEGLRRFAPLWDGRPVYAYVSTPQEVDTRGLIEELWEQRIPVAAPRVTEGGMEFFCIRGWEDLEKGFRGIWEPRPGCKRARKGERAPVILTPGAAFDASGYRIGYGGGYYDRYLKSCPEGLSLGLAYGFQVLAQLPREPFDQPVDWLLTERGLVFCGRMRGAVWAEMDGFGKTVDFENQVWYDR